LPFPRPGEFLDGRPRPRIEQPPQAPAEAERGLSRRESTLLALWLTTNLVVSWKAVSIVIDRAVKLPPGAELSTHYVEVTGATVVAVLLVAAVVAGAVTFRRDAPWHLVLLWPWTVGLAIGIGADVGASPQMDGGSRLCDLPRGYSCDTSWGMGAMLLGIAAAIVLGGAFVLVASARRLFAHLRARSSA
jgi:hypothetical protein